MNNDILHPGCLVKLKRSPGRGGHRGYSDAIVSKYGIGLYLEQVNVGRQGKRHKIYWFNLKSIFTIAWSVSLEVISDNE